jgi:RND family efflux transporter MFP subunit
MLSKKHSNKATIMKKIFIPLILIFLAVVFFGYKKSHSNNGASPIPKAITPVTVKELKDSHSIQETLILPATVISNQIATINAKSTGTITALNFDLGKNVFTGQLLVKIDDTGNNLAMGEDNLQSAMIQQLEQAKNEAKKSLTLANKKSYSIPNQIARDIAEAQYKSSQIALQSAIDNHLITAPLSGKIIAKNISLGDSVTQGQPLATISKPDQLKIQFFVDQTQYADFSNNSQITIIANDQKTFPAKVTNISAQADAFTKKFLVEAVPLEKTSLLDGTIVNISFNITKSPQQENFVFMPISAITVGQNENYLFIYQNGKAKKINISINSIIGEYAEVNLNFPKETQIIVSGNKALQDGDAVEIKNL